MNKKIGLVAPFALLNGGVLLIASFKALQISLGYYPVIGLKEWHLTYYISLFRDTYFQKSLGYSLTLSLVATCFAIIIGLLLACLIVNSSRRDWLLRLCQLPITLPYIIVVIMMLQLITQTGLIARLLLSIGFISNASAFPLLVHDQKGIGMMVVFLYKQIPYVIVTVVAVLQHLNKYYEQVAYNLGASKWQTYWYVLLPMIQPTIFTLFIVLFSFNFGSFDVPYLLGNPVNETVSVYAYQLLNQADLSKRPQAMAMNVIMSLLCGGISFLALTISHQLPGGRKGGMTLEKK